MADGSIHRQKGMLLRQRGAVILQLSEGARWRLQVEEIDHLIGEQVDVEGIQVGDDLLEVTRIALN